MPIIFFHAPIKQPFRFAHHSSLDFSKFPAVSFFTAPFCKLGFLPVTSALRCSLLHLTFEDEYMKKAPCKKQSASFNNIKFRHKKSTMLNYIVLNLKQIQNQYPINQYQIQYKLHQPHNHYKT